MTTKVRIEIVQKHVPVVVEVLRDDGSVMYSQTLDNNGTAAVEYVHSSQTLRVREMTTAEMHAQRAEHEVIVLSNNDSHAGEHQA